jgi:hypothetical protein
LGGFHLITPEGDYLSNLRAPDLRPYFKHLTWRKMSHSMGHLVASDWADKADDDPVFGLYKKCGLWTRDEVAILFRCATLSRGVWIDIGSHSGWTTAQILEAGNSVIGIDPMYNFGEFYSRSKENLAHWMPSPGNPEQWGMFIAETSAQWFFDNQGRELGAVAGVVIDGDHERNKPLEDAQNAAQHLAATGAILFHDFIGQPTREAVTWLMDHGFKARVYWTPHLVACCWRGDFTPPDHIPDSRIDWAPHFLEMAQDFDFGRLS